MNRYNIYDMNCSLPRIITHQTYGRNDGKGFTTLLEKDGEWVRYEDAKGLVDDNKKLMQEVNHYRNLIVASLTPNELTINHVRLSFGLNALPENAAYILPHR